MKISYESFLFLFCFAIFDVNAQSNALEIRRQRTEYLVNPRGIDVQEPRLSWELYSGANGQWQSAYQIMVGSDSVALTRGAADIWDSKKVISAQTNQVKVGGKKLVSKGKYFWKIKPGFLGW